MRSPTHPIPVAVQPVGVNPWYEHLNWFLG